MKKKVLITGFTKFGTNTTNPTEVLVPNLNLNQYNLKKIILPVEFSSCFQTLKSEIDTFNPDIIILCGLAADRTIVSVEKIGLNYIDANIADNAGLKPQNIKIEPNAPDGIFTPVDLVELINYLKNQQINCIQSFSAGTYVCNFLYFSTLFYLTSRSIPAIFIHFPQLSEQNTLDKYAKMIEKTVDFISVSQKNR